MSNVVKFTREARVHLRPSCRRFVVKDTGQGVDLAEIDTLFEAFTDSSLEAAASIASSPP